MKAFIFNSGLGSRMGDLTKSNPKALVYLSNGETILGRQIRLLKDSGIKDIVISTGPFENQIIELTKKFPSLTFTFVNNSKYKETNSIYSLYLAAGLLDDDIIMLHGDLVFDSLLLRDLINDAHKDLCLINPVAKQPGKDFKGRIIDSKLKEISVSIFDENCYALQPLYKLTNATMNKWFIEIKKFIENKNVNVYAENALNNILYDLNIFYMNYDNYYIEEIDNEDDLKRVSSEFRLYDYKNQKIVINHDYMYEIDNFIKNKDLKNPLVLHGKHLIKNKIFLDYITKKEFVTFTDYSPNPKYEEVLDGLKVFIDSQCDSIITIGGGSCIDTAKAIKLYSPFNDNYIDKIPIYVNIPLLAVPTTAGTGTESTRYSVIYFDGEKQSLVHDSILPDLVILNSDFLYNIPEYHKKSSLLDAFCQAIESFWSINSNDTSKRYSKKALSLILSNYKGYLNGDLVTYEKILLASNFAGKAINITQTTAPHAMSYKVTSTTGISHGHAVSIMLPKVLEFMINNMHLSQDPRGKNYVNKMFYDLASLFSVKSQKELVIEITEIILKFDLKKPDVDEDTIVIFSTSVNQDRLKNNPIRISESNAMQIYFDALKI